MTLHKCNTPTQEILENPQDCLQVRGLQPQLACLKGFGNSLQCQLVFEFGVGLGK